jgi:hypothetical protein
MNARPNPMDAIIMPHSSQKLFSSFFGVGVGFAAIYLYEI